MYYLCWARKRLKSFETFVTVSVRIYIPTIGAKISVWKVFRAVAIQTKWKKIRLSKFFNTHKNVARIVRNFRALFTNNALHSVIVFYQTKPPKKIVKNLYGSTFGVGKTVEILKRRLNFTRISIDSDSFWTNGTATENVKKNVVCTPKSSEPIFKTT